MSIQEHTIEPAHHYVKNNIKEYYHLSNFQYTIPKTDNKPYRHILNDEGLKLYEHIMRSKKVNDFKDTFTEYVIITQNSGHWEPNPKSQFYNENDVLTLCTFNNKYICGKTKGNPASSTETSIIIFYTNEWAYTKNGHLYKLEKRI